MRVVERPELVTAGREQTESGDRKERPARAGEAAPGPRQVDRNARQRHADHEAVHPQRRLLADAEIPGRIGREDIEEPCRERERDDRQARREECRRGLAATRAGRPEEHERHQEVEPFLDREAPGHRKELEVLAAEVLEEDEAVPVEAVADQREQREHEVVRRQRPQPPPDVEPPERRPRAFRQDRFDEDAPDQESAEGKEQLDAEKTEHVVEGIQVEGRPAREETRGVSDEHQPDRETAENVEPEVARGEGLAHPAGIVNIPDEREFANREIMDFNGAVAQLDRARVS